MIPRRFVCSLQRWLCVALLLLPLRAFAQVIPTRMETVQDLVGQLSDPQRQQFNLAMKDYREARYAESLTIFKQLLTDVPGDAILSKFGSEAALNTGDAAFAVTTLKPLAQADPNDWQAAALLTRACAETGDTACRDAGIAHMLDLHLRGITPPGLEEYIVERVKVEGRVLTINTSLIPWGPYKIYNYGQMPDSDGKPYLKMTVESNDFDQPLFAKEHPKEAAAGQRSFSLDAYRETGLNSEGQRTQTHYTFKFFIGRPSYQTVRDEFINIASGKSTAISSRSNLVVPQ